MEQKHLIRDKKITTRQIMKLVETKGFFASLCSKCHQLLRQFRVLFEMEAAILTITRNSRKKPRDW